MNFAPVGSAPRAAARLARTLACLLAPAFLAVALALVAGRASTGSTDLSTAAAATGSATGSADVRLVRLLSDLPDSMRGRAETLHDLRVRLVDGNVLVFKKGGEFAALLPIELLEGTSDSLRYFYYVEKPAFIWIFAGARSQGILTVGDGGALQFNAFQLRWGRGGDGLGWIYFPDAAANDRLRFSVVSGQSVAEADPKDTKYWIELGSEPKAGF